MKQTETQKSYFFLLGGSDLEMVEIRQMLESNGYVEYTDFLDKKPAWKDAKLSNYKDHFHPTRTNVAIELKEDCDPPKNYLVVDHHNELSEKPASIEQVAALIGVVLTRHQHLVAANDKAFIPGMIALGASEEEILDIRQKDRAAQGVTETDETLARQSIENHTKIDRGVSVVRSLTPKFSPITDRMYGKTGNRLLVYDEHELTYYGIGKHILDQNLSYDPDYKGKCYSGGGNDGFWGVNKNDLNKDEIEFLIQKIFNILFMNGYLPLTSDEPFYSYHVFLFPFQWQFGKDGKKSDFEDKINLEYLVKQLTSSNDWEQNPFKVNSLVNYNEYRYFYPFARDILFDTGSNPNDENFIEHLNFKLSEAKENDNPLSSNDINKYVISLPDKTYELEIDSIVLHLYSTGIGVLSYHLYNKKQDQSAPIDILKINQFGRRLYPPFYDTDQSLIGKQDFFTDPKWEEGLFKENSKRGVQRKELPKSISLHLINREPITENYFDAHPGETTPDGKPIFPNSVLVKKLLPDALFEKKFQLEQVLDDRMFVVCWYGNQALANSLSPDSQNNRPEPWLDSELWYKYIFVDAGMKTCQNDQMSRELIKAHTNARWANFGTFYGVSRYSFVALTAAVSELKQVDAAFLISHVQTMYYKMAELVLVQRASLLRFSGEVTEISSLAPNDEQSERVSDLYKHYIRFVNKIYFREITAQEQGIELYNMLLDRMNIVKEVEGLDKELQELHEYVQLKSQQSQESQMKKLTILASLFVIPSFIVGFFGSNIVDFKDVSYKAPAILGYPFFVAFLILITVFVFLSFYLKKTNILNYSGRKWDKIPIRLYINWWLVWPLILISIILILLMLLSPIFVHH